MMAEIIEGYEENITQIDEILEKLEKLECKIKNYKAFMVKIIKDQIEIIKKKED